MIAMICFIDAYATTDIICQYLKGHESKQLITNAQTNNHLYVMNRLVAIKYNYYV